MPGALRAIGARVRIHDDLFDEATPDVDWLAEVGRRRWVVLTYDEHILTRPAEAIALVRANVHAFILRGKNMNGRQMGDAFVVAYDDMCRLVASHQPPLLARVSRAGKVERIEGYKQLQDRIDDAKDV